MFLLVPLRLLDADALDFDDDGREQDEGGAEDDPEGGPGEAVQAPDGGLGGARDVVAGVTHRVGEHFREAPQPFH